ncbi:hypothetical protein SOVF_086200 [Spinacia oleracea]|nr:hypothetical protein SOVF_086200 [Spinacia oleracea]
MSSATPMKEWLYMRFQTWNFPSSNFTVVIFWSNNSDITLAFG